MAQKSASIKDLVCHVAGMGLGGVGFLSGFMGALTMLAGVNGSVTLNSTPVEPITATIAGFGMVVAGVASMSLGEKLSSPYKKKI